MRIVLLVVALSYLHLEFSSLSFAENNLEQLRRQTAKEFYESQEKNITTNTAKQIHKIMDALSSSNRSDKDKFLITFHIVDFEYQKLIDTLGCIENHSYTNEGIYCIKERINLNIARDKFIKESSIPDEIQSLCYTKSRLIEMETRYPPYDFMIKWFPMRPRAHDTKKFLECIRTRL